MKKMEGGDRPNRSGSSSSSELFICFTSRPSSSLKISSKSIPSPGRTDRLREGASASTLPSSLSRRLRSNGSMKGGQSSPMFPTGSKKKGCAFENPEPSSPKVTCIGQVRVKTKKQGKKMRTTSKQRSGSVDGSFRKMEQTHEGERPMPQQECLPSRNGRWVHLPLSICEAMRAFGAEFNCFVPCGGRSMCSSSNGEEREKGQKQSAGTTTTTSSCGTAFAKWLMALQESEEGKRREVVEEVVGLAGEEERDKAKAEGKEGDEKADVEIEEDEEDAGICIPPKNALLLMRCRSEPLRMASLANRFWDSPVQKEYRSVDRNVDEEEADDEDEEDHEEDLDEEQPLVEESTQQEVETFEEATEDDIGELLHHLEVEAEVPEAAVLEEVQQQKGDEEKLEMGCPPIILDVQENTPAQIKLPRPEKEEEQVKEAQKTEQEEEGAMFWSTEEEKEMENHFQSEEQEEEETQLQSSHGKENDTQFLSAEGEEVEARETHFQTYQAEQEEAKESEFRSTVVEGRDENNVEEQTVEQAMRRSCSSSSVGLENQEGEEAVSVSEQQEEKKTEVATAVEEEVAERREEKREGSPQLPECLLQMMCEPKLSMEVSRETWVCSTDFLRCRPDKRPGTGLGQVPEPCKRKETAAASKALADESKRTSTDSNPGHPPPNATLPPPPSSMATALEQKLVKAVAYEPFVLTRCKSEPVRSSARLAPEACFWKSRKLPSSHEPRLGIGAAGLGF